MKRSPSPIERALIEGSSPKERLRNAVAADRERRRKTTQRIKAGSPTYKGASTPLSGTQYVRDTGQHVLPGRHPGLVKRGNIDLQNRPVVRNRDGSISTVRSVSFNVGGRETLLPTVVGDRVVSNRAALVEYRRTGRHLGMFDSPTSATSYAKKLHEQQARAYRKYK